MFSSGGVVLPRSLEEGATEGRGKIKPRFYSYRAFFVFFRQAESEDE